MIKRLKKESEHRLSGREIKSPKIMAGGGMITFLGGCDRRENGGAKPTLVRFETIVSELTAKLTVTGTCPSAAVPFARRVAMRGRKPKQESRAAEIRARLAEWKRMPEFSRLSLRALARELSTTHQLLSYLEEEFLQAEKW